MWINNISRIFIFLFILIPSTSFAVTRNVTCSGSISSSLTSAISSSSSGDIINIGSGSCSASGVSVNKTNLIIQGQGIGSTILSSSGDVFSVSDQSANGLRITGMTVTGLNATVFFYAEGTGSTPKTGIQNLRIDHCAFSGTAGYVVQSNAVNITGVADHNTYTGLYPFYIMGGYPDMNYSVSWPFPTGTANAFFIEDNTFYPDGSGNAGTHQTIQNLGSSLVVRYNTFEFASASTGLWEIIDTHGACYQSTHGTFLLEVYNNKFKIPSGLERSIGAEGGQLIIYNNFFSSNSSWPIQINEIAGCEGGCASGQTCSSYPCRDQVRYSYFWGNKKNCGSDMTNCSGGSDAGVANDCSSYIQLGRDYYTSQQSGYTPYTYPHPLQSGGGDTTPPTITNVSSDKANGTYTVGEVIDIDVTLSEAVTSTGNVTVTLDSGGSCAFQVVNNTLGTCNYTVQAGNTSADLTVNSISGTILDQAGNAMTNFTPATNLAANKAIVIDTTEPTVTISTSNPYQVKNASIGTLTWTCSESTSTKWRKGFAPDGSNGTACTGTTSWSCAITGIAQGDNTYYVGCSVV